MPVFFDIETQNSFQEVGGRYPERLRVSVAVTYNTTDRAFHRYTEADIPALVGELQAADLIVGFNLYGFDYPVLKRYTSVDLNRLPTLDMLAELHKQLGFRVSLDSVAAATLGINKSADGLQAVQWWKEGRLEDIFTYCEKDVDITRQVYEFGHQRHYVQYFDRQYRLQRVPVMW
ncbi:MAG TPA: ribonuclease H-like domain-containing protein [Anaerolineae bacterium]|mgnify:CR=1 FL=1|nr:ribonuclease H-like domain-containing protein [Anaerolineae bacterium]HQK13039.1 ribonuclease H-like domain-containing protein [Anaerolineae bacterium]